MSFKALCKEHGFTFSKLSDETNISIVYLSNLSTGIKNNPSLEILDKVANTLGITIDEVAKAIMEED